VRLTGHDDWTTLIKKFKRERLSFITPDVATYSRPPIPRTTQQSAGPARRSAAPFCPHVDRPDLGSKVLYQGISIPQPGLERGFWGIELWSWPHSVFASPIGFGVPLHGKRVNAKPSISASVLAPPSLLRCRGMNAAVMVGSWCPERSTSALKFPRF
jgi:hypothetical protein